MSTTIQYKGNTLATVSNDTKTLKTAGKYMEGDVVLTDVSGGSPSLQTKTKTYTPTTSQQTELVTADNGYDGLDEVNVTVEAIPEAVFTSEFVGNVVTRSSKQYYSFMGNTHVTSSGYVASGDYNGQQFLWDYIPSTTVITPSESVQHIGGQSQSVLESIVTINPIDSNYVGSGITRRSSTDLIASGATVTVPSGYYSASASKSVASGTQGLPSWSTSKGATTFAVAVSYPNATEGYYRSIDTGTYSMLLENKTVTPSTSQQVITPTSNVHYLNSVTVDAMPSGTAGTPTATKGTVSNHSVSVTPSVINTTGYITGGTINGTAVTVSASELVSGTLNITSNGTKDVTNYASVSIGAGSVTPVANKGTVSNHTVSISPYADTTSGFIGSGRYSGSAVTVSASELVSGTKSITENGTNIDVTNYASVDVAVQGGMDVPIFTGTYNQSTGVVTITCNKTYEQCEDLVLIDGKSIAVIDFGNGVYSPLEGFCEDGTKVQYFGTEQGVPTYEIVYNENGTITFNDTSSVLDTLNVTENGTYTPPTGKVYNEVVVNVGSAPSEIQVAVATPQSGANSYLQFGNVLGNPISFSLIYTNDMSIEASYDKVSALTFDGTNYVGQIVTNTSNANASYLATGFSHEYYSNDHGIIVSSTNATFDIYSNYALIYTYGGSASDIHTADVQVGSGAASITFPVSGRPKYWSCVFKSNFGTSQGYQRVIAVANNGTNTYGLCLDSSAHASNSYWTTNYSGGNFTISSQSTNAGGYFHQPGYYQLTYIVDDSAPSYQTKTVTPTTSQQTVTADSGYDALSQVTINAMPTGVATSATTISGTAATVSTGTNTLTLTKTVSNTPRITTAGYISTGTAGNSSVTLTANVTTKAAATITPGTTNQTIAAGTYLTGTQTIAGDADLVASNIVNGVQIFGVTGNVVLQNYYTGSSAPSSSTGSNGDLYLQS